jgi:hypothetical protein
MCAWVGLIGSLSAAFQLRVRVSACRCMPQVLTACMCMCIMSCKVLPCMHVSVYHVMQAIAYVVAA